ncbi:MAG: hypothetical protein VX904_02255, partial [Planctomycetota bacterium]|nr:hypothetical protein [Planctomycetota bacterium]
LARNMAERHRMPLSIHRLTTQIRRTLTVPPSPEALRRDQLPSRGIETFERGNHTVLPTGYTVQNGTGRQS